jgi:hypothetical protein
MSDLGFESLSGRRMTAVECKESLVSRQESPNAFDDYIPFTFTLSRNRQRTNGKVFDKTQVFNNVYLNSI